MTTPAHTPGGSPLPVPHGVGNPSGTPVVAPTRSAPHKDGGGNSSLGTFGVSSSQHLSIYQHAQSISEG